MPEQTRRHFILLAGGAAGATAAWTVFGAPSTGFEPLVLDPALQDIIASGVLSVEVGEKYLDAAGAAATNGEELAGLVDGLPPGLTSAALAAAMRERVARDFAEGALCEIGGWHLSLTECRLGAVAFLYQQSGGLVGARPANTDGPLAHLPNARLGVVDRWGPTATQVGKPFNVQPSGESALWFHFSRLEALSFEIFLGKYPTRTVVRHGERFAVANLSERLAQELVSRAGAHPVFLVEPGRGKQLIGRFHVRPDERAEKRAVRTHLT